MKGFYMRMPESLHQAVKVRAAQDHTTMQAFILRAVEQAIETAIRQKGTDNG